MQQKDRDSAKKLIGFLVIAAILIAVIASCSYKSGSGDPSDTPRETESAAWSSSDAYGEPDDPVVIPEITEAAPRFVQPDTHEKTNEYLAIAGRTSINRVCHAYDGLFNDKQRFIYRMMEYVVGNITDEMYDGRYKTEAFYLTEPLTNSYDYDIDVAYNAFWLDNPQTFWIRGYYYITNDGVTKATLLSSYSADDTARMKGEMSAAVGRFCAGITASMTQYEREKKIHDYLVDNVTYDEVFDAATSDAQRDKLHAQHPEFSTAYGSLIRHNCVCGGYARGFQLLCQCAGMDCTVICGYATTEGSFFADGTSHSWNAVNVDGDWYQVDVTWDDADYVAGRYLYFNVSDSQIANDHYTQKLVASDRDLRDRQALLYLPSCTATRRNYFVYDSDVYRVSSITDRQIPRAMLNEANRGSAMTVLYIDPSVISVRDAEKLMFQQGDDNYMRQYCDYVRERCSYTCIHYTYWCHYYRGAFYIRLND